MQLGKYSISVNRSDFTPKAIYQILKLNRKKIAFVFLVLFFIWYITGLPKPLIDKPYSTILNDKKGNLLGGKIAEDGQWRFESQDSVPYKFEKCILTFEDKNFYGHFGISIKGIGRAIVQNIKSKKIKSGGSTISMQVVRLAFDNKDRTFFQKLKETILSTRLECSYSKKEILSIYTANAPFGGNVVGLQAASWRYYGKASHLLSWSEAATLAVLPNAPSLIFPGKNKQALENKRNRLLKTLLEENVISKDDYSLALAEPLPNKPYALPKTSSHLLDFLITQHGYSTTYTATVDEGIQQQMNDLLERHMTFLHANEIHNAALMVFDIKKNELLAYVGNSKKTENENFANEVDVIQAKRSSGSILKPFLYGHMLNDGNLLPNELLPDVPCVINGFNPQNFNLEYDGVVTARQALARSLNVPAVKMLQQYGTDKFLTRLREDGFYSIRKSADHYGLSLILGGAEVTLWEVCNAYNAWAQKLLNKSQNKYQGVNYCKNNYPSKYQAIHPSISKGAIYQTLEAMSDVSRPDLESNWRRLSNGQQVAWKTGTSIGFRDAWSIGISGNYLIGVWVGNADGEGRPQLTGIKCAAPILFDALALLPHTGTWFTKPANELHKVVTCARSGFPKGIYCDSAKTTFTSSTTLQVQPCPYHQLVNLNAEQTKQVNVNCYPLDKIVTKKWFVLPAGLQYFYSLNNPNYKTLPDFEPSCKQIESNNMEIIYPKQNASIYIPKELNNEKGKVVFQAAHNRLDAFIYWHVDNEFVLATHGLHQIGLQLTKGKHHITIIDDKGERQEVDCQILSE